LPKQKRGFYRRSDFLFAEAKRGFYRRSDFLFAEAKRFFIAFAIMVFIAFAIMVLYRLCDNGFLSPLR